MKTKPIHTDSAPAAIGPYSQAVMVGNVVYLSGQIALSPTTMTLVGEDVTEQAHQIFKNLRSVARAAGGDLTDLVKLTIYLCDLNNFPIVNEVMTQYFKEPYPARATVGVRALPKNAQLEIEAVMALGERP